MKLAHGRSLIIWTAGVAGAAILACSSGPSEPGATPTADPKAAPVPTSTQSAVPAALPYDPNLMMYRVFPGIPLTSQGLFDPVSGTAQLFVGFEPMSHSALDALQEVRRAKDRSQVPVLVEILEFLSPDGSREAVTAALRELTGQGFDGDDYKKWTEWLGKNLQAFRPPEQYVEWKTHLMSQIDPRFGLFLNTAKETARIDLTEVVWGGVVPDGIPDLRDPKIVSPAEADYLGGDERVFGVSINGEHRAYPLRIVNPHEMVNDVLGGEPIAVSF